MASRFSELVIDARDIHTQARWWADVLDYTVTSEDADQVEISPSGGGSPPLVFVPVPEGRSRQVRAAHPRRMN